MPENVRRLLERLGGERRVLFIGVGVAMVVVILAISRWATAPTWVPLLPGMPLTMVGEVTAKLEEYGIQYRLDRAGSVVRVRDADLARVRVALARDGIPESGRPGFELFDQPAWGMTDFTQRINYRRALEGELERTIEKMDGIEDAQVHLALQESPLFRRSQERRSAASVVVRLRSGARPGPELVEGITFLVASAVDGLLSENVTVLDHTGRVLNASVEPGSSSAPTRRQLAAQREVEQHLEQKAEDLLGQVVGAGNARVRVAATIRFDRIDRTVQSVDPEQQVVLREETSEITPGPNTEGAASATSSTSFDVTRMLETYSSAVGAVERLTVAVLVNDRKVEGPDGVRMEPRTPEELARLEALVRNAVGIDESRGDAISVVNVPFEGGEPVLPAPEGGLLVTVQQYHRQLLTLVALALAFVIGLRVLAALRPPAPPQEPAAPELPEEPEPAPALPEGGLAAINLAGRERISAALSDRPDVATRVLRAWLKDG
ncbi:MAG TPA: flagellar basal-body MS-ring/collar protein FliF [Longimicrobiales bacterium]|nr:flagellar basal-body MS-ring/collar protein FliF [Longimicrobiales bacterium]